MLSFTHSYQTLPKAFYQAVSAAAASNPKLLLFNEDLAANLALDLAAENHHVLAQWFCGQNLPDTASPIAQAYAGHQFGHLSLLGDGRALLLGEIRTPQQQQVDIQLKGSGPTSYSRGGDGKAALAPMLREYLMSEAMFALGIPTSRSLAVVTTGDTVRRMGAKTGAVLTRTAASHIRIGTFVYAAILAEQQGSNKPLQALLDYSIQRHYPELAANENPALTFLSAVGQRQIRLINQWLRVGFIHGVMNTDNVCISGETIDYGPCAFMNAYDEATVFSSIDHSGRYAYGNQSPIILWNMARLAESLLPLIDADENTAITLATEALDTLATQQQQDWQIMMSNKLGLAEIHTELVEALTAFMQTHNLDYTNTFVTLTAFLRDNWRTLAANCTAEFVAQWLNSEAYQTADYAEKKLQHPDIVHWYQQWLTALQQQYPHADKRQTAVAAMQDNNPMIIPRNHQVEAALHAAEQGDRQPFENLLNALSMPYQPLDSGKLTPISRYQTPPTTEQQAGYQTFCGT